MSTVQYTSLRTNQGFLLSSIIGVDVPAQLVMSLRLDDEGNPKVFPSAKDGMPRALLASPETGAYAYVSEAILSKLQFDDNGYTVIDVVKTPDAKAVKPTRTFSVGGVK